MQVYLDNSATTRLDERVFEKMKPYLTEKYGNASSIHFMGEENSLTLLKAKEQIGRILNCDHSNLIFTSGATESNNMVLKGVMRSNKDPEPSSGGGNHILVSAIEHPSILETAKQLKEEGFDVEYIPVDSSGVVDLTQIKKMVRPETLLISVMAVNNEIGTIQPVETIGAFARKKGILFHTDAVQAVPYKTIDIRGWNADFLSLSAHKFNGPKGVGLAYINRRVKIRPFMAGGGQEYGLRSGTHNLPGIVGMAEALRLAYEEQDEIVKKVSELSAYFWKRIQEEIEDVQLNGDLKNRNPNNLNIMFRRIEGEAILMDLSTKGICVSTGSACSSNKLQASNILKAIGLKDNDLNSNIRFTLGKFNTKEEIDYTVGALKETVARLRSFTPLK
ncbi:cysteine desulfurase [Candidatus Peregrinibacteria bacterium]|nr:cysteine desulfurase [Candidatus Peregrinibacteria bacterium]